MVRLIEPHSKYYGKLFVLKAMQADLNGKPSTALITSVETGEMEVPVTAISTSLKRVTPQTEMFL